MQQLDEFLAAQCQHLDLNRQNPYFVELIGSVDRAYREVIRFHPSETSLHLGQIVLICHKSLLSAASLIAMCQPEDAAGITRRAVEAAKVALAIKIDDKNRDAWLAYLRRQERWRARRDNKKPKPVHVEFSKGLSSDPRVTPLNKLIGVLSDSAVHYTPEFEASLNWKTEHQGDDGGEMHLRYFCANKCDIALAFLVLATDHGTILRALDDCYDGHLNSQVETRKSLDEMWNVGKAFHSLYEQECK